MLWKINKDWFGNYKIVFFLLVVTLGWIVLWGAWMLFIIITKPH